VAAVGAGIIGLALTIAAIALFGSRTALSVGIGATIAVINLVTMRAIIRALVRSSEAEDAEANANANANAKPEEEEPKDHVAEGKRGGAAWGAFALVKILVLFGGIWILLTRGLVDPIPLVVGYGVLPLGIATSSLFASLAPRSRGKSRPTRQN
jgi:hypothetical protein